MGGLLDGRGRHSVPTTPRLFLESNHASGTKNPHGGTWSTYDQVYPSQHDKLGFADQIGKRNIWQIRAGVAETISKKRKVSLRQAYMDYWLATTHDGLYSNAGTPLLPAAPFVHARHIGQELDVIGTYQINRRITASFGYSRVFAGRYLKTVTPGRDFSYPFCSLEYGL